MDRNIYYISGLGADERVFTHLQINNANEVFIKWIEPKKQETLRSYSKLLIAQIDTTKTVILIGVSFGGIVVQEIAKHIQVEKVIIISSVKSFNEFSLSLKLASKTKIHKIIPSKILKWSNKLSADYFFGTKSKKESDLLKAIINDTNEKFMIWAIDQIMNWKQKENEIEDIIHIHGDKDRIFSNKKLKDVIWIKEGGHFMIVNKADEISRIINKTLYKIENT